LTLVVIVALSGLYYAIYRDNLWGKK